MTTQNDKPLSEEDQYAAAVESTRTELEAQPQEAPQPRTEAAPEPAAQPGKQPPAANVNDPDAQERAAGHEPFPGYWQLTPEARASVRKMRGNADDLQKKLMFRTW